VIELVPTTINHVVRLGLDMRRGDADECRALGLLPLEAVLESWEASDRATTLLFDGEVAACAGLVLEPSETALSRRRAQVWLLTSPLVVERPLEFHRAMKALLQGAAAHADVLWNYVDARYESSLRWLAYLGFTVREARPHGPLDMPFCLVTRES
jgi:hypothetical protein